ncbi:MAG: hypothetical protein FWE44_03535 [Defluviitaleaceae bacterium]|nr:hypothetical protein [Defluviitaleaceae bacterium]
MKKRLSSVVLALVILFTANATIVFGHPARPPIDPTSITLPPIVIDIDSDC